MNQHRNDQAGASTSTRSAESLFAELCDCQRRGDYKAARVIATELRTAHGWSCVKTAVRSRGGAES